jgi:hypothetical protein
VKKARKKEIGQVQTDITIDPVLVVTDPDVLVHGILGKFLEEHKIRNTLSLHNVCHSVVCNTKRKGLLSRRMKEKGKYRK